MTNEQLLYWIEGFLSDKHSNEAYAIKSKISSYRKGSDTIATSITETDSLTKGLVPDHMWIAGSKQAAFPQAVPMPPNTPVWLNCASEPDPF